MSKSKKTGTQPPEILFEVSKAPPPITSVDTSQGPDLTIRHVLEKPDWGRWQRIDRTRLWKAACLVAGFEPPSSHGQEIWALYQIETFPQKFFDVWDAVNGDEGLSRLEFQSYSGRMLHTVNLGWFAHWAMTKGFEIPQELRKIADRYRTAHSQITETISDAQKEPESALNENCSDSVDTALNAKQLQEKSTHTEVHTAKSDDATSTDRGAKEWKERVLAEHQRRMQEPAYRKKPRTEKARLLAKFCDENRIGKAYGQGYVQFDSIHAYLKGLDKVKR